MKTRDRFVPQYPFQTTSSLPPDKRHLGYFRLVEKLSYCSGEPCNTGGEVLARKLYDCFNNLSGERRMIRGEDMLKWFEEVAGSTYIGHVCARFTIIPIHEDSRN